MHVHVDRRQHDEPKRMALLRERLMKVEGQRFPEVKTVLCLSGQSLLTVLHVVHLYASVDSYTIMPILIMINVFTFTNTLVMFGILL